MTSEEAERVRIVKFLWDVFYASTHGASGLMERAIRAVEANKMSDPVRVAAPASWGLPSAPTTPTLKSFDQIIREAREAERV